MLKMEQLDLAHQRVLIRQDLNVPMREGVIANDARLKASLPTLRQALQQGAKLVVMSHLGRPKEGHFNKELSLQPVANYLSQALKIDVELVQDLEQVEPTAEKIILLENVRFNVGEKNNDAHLAAAYAEVCDVFVMDAFGTAHRAHASTYGVMQHAKVSCAGPLLSAEVEALSQVLQAPQRPLVAIVGGSKVSTKLQVLHALAHKVDYLIVGGGIANTFLAAEGYEVGASLYEPDFIASAKEIQNLTQVPLPIDVVTATYFASDASAKEITIDAMSPQDMILDLGTKSSQQLADIIAKAGTIIWNGPVGVFEFEAFSRGTRTLAKAIAESEGYSLAGGGDTLAAIDVFDIAEQINYISTGGGAFLEFIEGKSLPALAMLEQQS